MAECPHCEYNKKRAQNWRVEAYRLAGHPLPEQEPVAHLHVTETDPRVFGRVSHVYGDHPISFGLPQQRTWVGLTDEEIDTLESATDTLEFPQTVRAIEAKLKEKNT